MKHLNVLQNASDIQKRALFGLRIAVCRHCAARPAESECLEANSPRDCEKECELFTELPRLVHAARCVDPMLGSFEHIMEEQLESLSRHAAIRGSESEGIVNLPHPWVKHKPRIIRILQNAVR